MGETAPAHPLLDRWFGPIEEAAQARALARDLAIALVVVAVIQAALALARGRDALADAALFAVAGALFGATRGRLAAAFALVVAVGSTGLAVATLALGRPPSGGRSILLGLAAVWIAGRALAAATVFRRLTGAGPTP